MANARPTERDHDKAWLGWRRSFGQRPDRSIVWSAVYWMRYRLRLRHRGPYRPKLPHLQRTEHADCLYCKAADQRSCPWLGDMPF